MSRPGHFGPVCPICTLPAIKELGPSVDTSALATIDMNDLDWDVIHTLVPKCDLCKLLVDLRQHWDSDKAHDQMDHDGITYRRMCENGNWWPPAFPRRTLYTVFVDFDSVAAKRFHTYEISSNPLSDRSKRQMKHWIGSCMSNHAKCPSKLKGLPTRVIDVRGTTLKLLDPSPSGPNAYVALSHCWGSCRDFLTTRENVEERKGGFDIGHLPLTFRDAVLATRALDIPHLWVDSICILQGDKEDWETEGSKLADIYSDATITICAANATDDAEGFLRQRQRPPTATIEIRWPSLEENVRKDQLTRFYVHREHDSRDRKDFLSERAWCMQERYLSPRLISFAQDAIEWECFEAEVWETSRPGSTSGLSIFSGRDDDQRLYSKWAEMVEHYSRRALTYTTDTLPALSAVASRAATAMGDEYLAGLWRKDLLRWLLWRGVRYGGGFNRTENPTRSEVNHAPSWSWASYAGPVSFQAPPSEEKYQVFKTIANMEADVVVPGKNKFGSVSSATLHIQTPLLNCKARSD
ncbi:heterokaryon incompatibility protein-domain-containing protein, partial [Paraphoma chrysanthemicola]